MTGAGEIWRLLFWKGTKMANKNNQEIEKVQDNEKDILTDIAYAQDELNQLKRAYGLEEEEKGLKRLISKTLEKRETREKVAVSKKKYVLLGFLLGIFGGHRFYAKQYVTATIYLLLFWTGISISMTLIDLMIVAPMKADENGNIML